MRKIALTRYSVFLVLLFTFSACSAKESAKRNPSKELNAETLAKLDTAYFASGCFWCTEAVFERVEGVEDVVSGYSGGSSKNPTYKQVSAGLTDHAEAVRVLYDPDVVSYKDLVYIFFGSHDPTQLNRQGPDVGKQYRSAIFYTTSSEQSTAKAVMEELDSSGKYKKPIVTEITEFSAFYEAEDYHQDYYDAHPNQPYIVSVSKPKVEKFMKEFKDKLKAEYK
ncbi:peptide-methionine (S)-S-oxide reductase [Fulvivirga sp. RKSG066]|uniref:peptide-methionine (S)-S-oxide reductase MsrA n=1 Tax=Fulvivirga aurantia TaxID=2529383 RepID=UPI0012BD75E3|nr:peptide-methionine (S)-S-oxide reductase MsrA [Fulvivirga aurantia]MTI23100.1 peptide-methionine (S)-S-oxide reductase [Fulvivirga aurantia]